MPRTVWNVRTAGSRLTLLAAVFAAATARGQSTSSPPLVILGPENAAEVEARRETAERAISQDELAMGRRLDPSYRSRLIDRVAAVRAGASAARPVTSALGDSSADLVYTPVTPCRVFDTRTAGGALAPGVPRSLVVAGSERFEAQGGKAGGCGVPLGPATAVVLNLVAVAPHGSGNLRAWAANDPAPAPPLASALNFSSVPGLYALANGLDLPICDPAAVGSVCSSDLLLEANGSSTDVVGDVFGYFRKADLGAVLLTGTSFFGAVTTGGTLHLGIPTIVTIPKYMECLVTCSITVASDSPNSVGYAYVLPGASGVDIGASLWGGTSMYAAPVASPGASSATTMSQIGLGGPYSWRFGCYVSAAGDFLGDALTGVVSWVCH